MTTQDLLDLKQEIEEAKETCTKLEGRKETLMEQLQKKFGVKTIPAAEKKLKAMEKEINEWDEKIETAIAELETKLNGDGQNSDTPE